MGTTFGSGEVDIAKKFSQTTYLQSLRSLFYFYIMTEKFLIFLR